MDDAREQRLSTFVSYVHDHLNGDEKGEAQVFLDRLFQAFGQAGVREAGATLEARVKNDRGGTAFADLVWKPIVLIEMKKAGEDLSRHLSQAFDYWIRLTPGRPRYVVLCNFHEFRIYDFDQDINEPQDTLTLDELPERWGPLAFLFPTREEPRFRINREKVTREAADLLAAVYKRIKDRPDIGRPRAQRFILQALIALFAEDIKLLPEHFFTQLLDECVDPPKAFDLLDGLFRAMNDPHGARGGRYRDVPFFNGGIFSESAAIELDPQAEIAILKTAATYNWSHISPDIFGTIFQHSMEEEERHAYGAHYTSPADIMKIVGPTIVQPWRTAIRSARSIERLRALHERLQRLRVLDPACGSGNFLYIAYRELKRIEKELVDRMGEVAPTRRHQRQFGFVRSRQFYGMDVLPFAVELAKVTMTLAHKLSIDELHVDEPALPLDNLDDNIRCMDALIDEKGERPEWPAADVIIGNPPFLGAKRLKPERGADYANAVRKLYPEVPGMADYCVYWFRRAHDELEPATPDDPFTGRAGLVGTQNIRNNKSRVGGLDHVVANGGVIVEAVDNQPWSGEANVHVSIANWVKAEAPVDDSNVESLLIPSVRRLWYKIPAVLPLIDRSSDNRRKRKSVSTPGKRGKPRADKSFELTYSKAAQINSALSSGPDMAPAKILRVNTRGFCYTGQYPRHNGFMLPGATARRMLAADPRNREVIHPFAVGREFLSGPLADRWVIDFQLMEQLAARSYAQPFNQLEKSVLPHVQEKAAKEHERTGKDHGQEQTWLLAWWQHFRPRPELIGRISSLSRYVVCSRVTKRPVFAFLDPTIRPGDALSCFAFEDDYSFGILQSDIHWRWFTVKCSKLTERFRYTPESVFDTFPWPQSPSAKQIRAVAEAGREIRRIRDEVLPTIKGGLRALYRTLELPGKSSLKDAHAALDRAVLDAYAFDRKADLLTQLLELNLAVAEAETRAERVTPPGIPDSYPNPADLVTNDCIQP